MDKEGNEGEKRKRGKDKAQRSFDLNGKFSAKHVRARAVLLEVKGPVTATTTVPASKPKAS
jgi:hypothetical protein